MGTALALLGVAFASALIPLINIEAYLIGLGVLVGSAEVWQLSALAGAGQMAGKVLWYYLGSSALRWGWVRRRMERPKAQAKLVLWQSRIHDRPVVAGLLVFASAASGFPPFAVVSVLAGQLRMSLTMFLAVGFLGRTLRFAAFLGGAGWLTGTLQP